LPLDDDVTERQLDTERPSASTHIAIRRSLRVIRRRWHRMPPLQRVVLVAAVVVLCFGVLRLGGGGGQEGGGRDLPVASLAAVKEQQKQNQKQQQQQRQQQQQQGKQPKSGEQQQQQQRRKAQAPAASRRDEAQGAAPAAAGAAAKPVAAAGAATGGAGGGGKGKKKAAAAAAVDAGAKQPGKAAASPLAKRKQRKAGRKQQAAKKKTKKAVAPTVATRGSSTSTSGGGSTAKWKTAASSIKGKGKGKGKSGEAKPAATAAGAEAHRLAAAKEVAHAAAAADKEEPEAGGLLDHMEDGDALPGAADAATAAAAGGDGPGDMDGDDGGEDGAATDAADTDTGTAGVASAPAPKEPKAAVVTPVASAATAAAGGAAAAATTATAVVEQNKATGDSLPKLFYCLPNGGFNDICVETWWCIDYAQRTGRALVWGYHNYIPQVPPYEPYFTLQPIENVTQLSQAEAAAELYAERARRKAQRRFKRIRIHPRRLKIDFLLGEDDVGRERKAQGNPLFINAPGMPQFQFNFSIPHTMADVVVFHKIGNRGSGFETLRHMRFSDEIKRTFLERWAQLSQPYIGLHVRSTDRSCPREKIERLLKHTRQLSRSRALKGANVYLATDNPEDSEEFLLELRDKQERAIKSFTFIPSENEDGERVPLHLNRNLEPEEKHQTNVDGFVDLLLLAFCDHFIKTCGGYGRLANHLHKDKATALSLIGETLAEGQEVEDVLKAAVARMRAEHGGEEGGEGEGSSEQSESRV
jgi:hypothetical protein